MVKARSATSRLLRWLSRLPLQFYRCRCAWLLGSHFLRLRHRGRKTGWMREAVLEVVHHDPSAGHFYVGSGWGPRADWYLNLLKYPEAEVDFRGRRWAVRARPLAMRHGHDVLEAYEKTHPILSRCLKFLLGEGVWEQVRVVRLEVVT